jgi:hypothetical protein
MTDLTYAEYADACERLHQNLKFKTVDAMKEEGALYPTMLIGALVSLTVEAVAVMVRSQDEAQEEMDALADLMRQGIRVAYEEKRDQTVQ